MKTKKIVSEILKELSRTAELYEQEEIDQLIKAIQKAERIFVCGAGRSLLVAKAFAMRLMHCGYSVYVVGETVTPAIGDGDLLVVVSGSGETGSLINNAAKAGKLKAQVALITTNRSSTIAGCSNIVVEIKTSTSKLENGKTENRSIQPGGNTFEQSALLLLDAVIISLMPDDLEGSNRTLMKLHANLE